MFVNYGVSRIGTRGTAMPAPLMENVCIFLLPPVMFVHRRELSINQRRSSDEHHQAYEATDSRWTETRVLRFSLRRNVSFDKFGSVLNPRLMVVPVDKLDRYWQERATEGICMWTNNGLCVFSGAPYASASTPSDALQTETQSFRDRNTRDARQPWRSFRYQFFRHPSYL